ncbi:MAG: hypothetical protein NZ610_01770 [Candidatus Bipolaricaulota bacterium]|nr:hypothetical protein [Candidatus Bipolaricaulota bacterium]MCS7274121.1 hypothetical protein [Candidatus Bipolaricaulota bacterium]MDW8111294.1 hypothetical protein [Candidatus Bipolaricaulota bacterium]MDW8328570.1 hypothetical protein [Candidatus Bipolaricaulota bacterium]
MAPRQRAALIGSLAIIAALLSSCDLFTPPLVVMREGFESGLKLWHKGLDVPPDPSTRKPVVWEIDLSQERVIEGNWATRWFLDGRQGDGTIWLVTPLSVHKNRPLTVTLSLQLWSATVSAQPRAHVVAYAGSLRPVEETEFSFKEPADKRAGWQRYRFVIPVGSTEGELWGALEISAAQKTLLEYFIDDVRVEVR